MRLREFPDVLHGRPSQRDASGGVVAESGASFSASAEQGFRVLVPLGYNTSKAGRGEKAISTEVVVLRHPSGGAWPATSRVDALSKRAGLLCRPWRHLR